jgi:ketosteroid isomerase-like protein
MHLIMKFYFISILLCSISTSCQAQTDSKTNADEMAIRKIEELGRIAMETQDTLAMYTLVSPDYVVMNPNNKIHGRPGLIELLTMWKQHNAAMHVTPPHIEHIIQKITINKDIAIVMGQDVPDAGATGPDGKPMSKHAYSNIYRKSLDSWQLIARQNSTVCQ